MKKDVILKAKKSDLVNWLKEFTAKVQGSAVLGKKMKDYLLRKMDSSVAESVHNFLKSRTSIIMYLHDAGDFTESQAYTEEETKVAVGLLMPADFDVDKDCAYCLKSFNSKTELQSHVEKCTI